MWEIKLFPEQVTENTGRWPRLRKKNMTDLRRYVRRGDGGCGGHGDGALLSLKSTSDMILHAH